jgi:RNA polymerase sigma-70 factor (ECF subfamily)
MTFPNEIAAQRTNMMRYARKLTRNRDDAEDLVQEAICRALRHHTQYEPGTNLRAWLFTILHNEHVNRTRAAHRRGSEVQAEEVAFLLPAIASGDSRCNLVEAIRAVNRLPKDMATVLLLAMEGRDYGEIAELTNAPPTTVRSRLCRGRAALREALQASVEGAGRSASRRGGRPLHTFDVASCAPARVVVPEGEDRMNYLDRFPRPEVAASHRPGSGSGRPSTQGPSRQPTVPSPRSGAAMRGHPFIFADGISLQQCINELRTITERLNESSRTPRRLAILRRTQDHLEELARCPIYDIARLPAARMK